MSRRPRRFAGRACRKGSAFLLVFLLVLLLDWSGASAETGPRNQTVIVLQPTTASLAARRSLSRIHDEVAADRFCVVVADSSTAGDPGAVIERAANDREGSAVLALFGEPETGQAELCVIQRAARGTAVRRATVVSDDPDRMPELLAARALELLRATALELSLESGRAPPVRSQPEAGIEADSRLKSSPPAMAPRAPPAVAVMGVGVWNSIEGPPAALMPFARVGLRLSEWAWVRASIAGLGTRPRLESPRGTAELSQSIGLAELSVVFRHDKRVQPTLSLGAGALSVAVAGTGLAPYEGREPHRWSAAFDAGAGLAVAVSPRAALVAELHALLAAPHVVVRIADTRAAMIGNPSLMLTLGLQVSP